MEGKLFMAKPEPRKWKDLLVDLICVLFQLLFVYAAMSKLLEFEKFLTQIGQSPILTEIAGWVAWLVPASEIVLAVALGFSRTRPAALYGCFTIMSVFTVYIITILNFSNYVPCSCGGVLQRMDWTQHLVFNLVFVGLSCWAILLQNSHRGKGDSRRSVGALLLCFLFAAVSVTVLYEISVSGDYSRNNFRRLFRPHPLAKIRAIDLGFNSYYVAGIKGDSIYLGNTVAPAHLLRMTRTLKDTQSINLNVEYLKHQVRKSPRITLSGSYFYVMDRGTGKIFRGNAQSWVVDTIVSDNVFYSLAVPISPRSTVIRATSSKTGSDMLGTVSEGTHGVNLRGELLEKQIDGVFCTDGMLHYSDGISGIVYLYYYRNEYVVADTNLTLRFRGKTIDTVSRAKIKVAQLADGSTTMARPPLVINRKSCVWKANLFVNSTRIAQNENRAGNEDAAAIDVYDLKHGNYKLSFYLPGVRKERLQQILVSDNKLIALYNRTLVSYQLNVSYFE